MLAMGETQMSIDRQMDKKMGSIHKMELFRVKKEGNATIYQNMWIPQDNSILLKIKQYLMS